MVKTAMKRRSVVSVLQVVLLLFSFVSLASAETVNRVDDDSTVRGYIIKAVSTHPEVQAKWHAYRAAHYEQRAAEGGWRPKVDVTAGIGLDSLDGMGYSSVDLWDYSRNGVSAFLTQTLYDGNLTNSSVKRYNRAMRMRYFDLIATMEQSALAAIHVQADLARYNNLVELARENLERHRELYGKVEQRTREGLDSAVNLETAKGRLALARVNMITEESNLHDTITQFVRIVGEMPQGYEEDFKVDYEVPAVADLGVDEALRSNPLLLSYAENSRSMYWAVEEQRANFRPRLELRAGTAQENDIGGTEGWRRKSYIELVAMYNIYNGGRDDANLHRSAEQHKEALELFSKLQRDIVQSVLIAHNDIRAYENQLPNLFQHSISANATRDAYIRQFEAGRRSLLDLLDSENESYQAALSYVNAIYNHKTVIADYLASTGNLLRHYDIVRDDVPAAGEMGYSFEEEAAELALRDLAKKQKKGQ